MKKEITSTRLGIKESRAFIMIEGFHLLKPEHRYRATRVSRFQEYHPSELIQMEVSKFDPLSLPLVLRYANDEGKKRLERNKLYLIRHMVKPNLPS